MNALLFVLTMIWMACPGTLLGIGALLYKEKNRGGAVVCFIASALIFVGGVVYIVMKG